MVFLIDVIFYKLPIFVIKLECVGCWPDHTATLVGDLVTIWHDHLRIISIDILA